MYFLRIDGTPSTSPFIQSNASPFPPSYSDESVVVGFGQNHLYYLNVPGLQPGQSQIFVIHYAYWQPLAQTYTPPSFPQTKGQTVSIPLDSSSVPVVFAFIPEDGSGTFLINVDLAQNSTVRYPAPPVNDVNAQYAATSSLLVQLTSDYQMYTLDISKTGTSWTPLKNGVLDALKGENIGSGTGGGTVSTGSGMFFIDSGGWNTDYVYK